MSSNRAAFSRAFEEGWGEFVILGVSARYPSGPRERSAKPPFVGSNPTRASSFLVSNQWITTLVSFPPSPTWEHWGPTGKRVASLLLLVARKPPWCLSISVVEFSFCLQLVPLDEHGEGNASTGGLLAVERLDGEWCRAC